MSDPLYLFGLVPADTATVPTGGGIDGTHPLERLELGELIAIVSTVSEREFVGPEAEDRLRDLAWVGPRALRHQAVVRDLIDQGPVIPVRFATLFSDAEALRMRIIRHQATLLEFLERTRDQAEWSVKALYDRKSALAYTTRAGPGGKANRADGAGAGTPLFRGAEAAQGSRIGAGHDLGRGVPVAV